MTMIRSLWFVLVAMFPVGAMLVLRTATAQAQTVILDESLLNAPADPRFAVEGGSYPGQGWKVEAENDKVVIDLGHGINSGIAEVDVTEFDPSQATGTNPEFYCVVFGMFAQAGIAHGDGMTSVAYELMAFSGLDPTRTYNLKFANWGPGQETAGYVESGGQRVNFDPWMTSSTYHIKVTWDLEGATVEFADTTGTQGAGARAQHWRHSDWSPPTFPQPGLRHLYIGRDLSACDPVLGAVYSNVKVTEMPDPCAEHCTDGAQNCDEGGQDCGGGCAACGEPDGGTAEDADGSGASGGSGGTGAGGDGGAGGTTAGGSSGAPIADAAAGSGGSLAPDAHPDTSHGGTHAAGTGGTAPFADGPTGGASGADQTGWGQSNDDSGCGCRVSGQRSSHGPLSLIAAGLAALLRGLNRKRVGRRDQEGKRLG